MPPDSPRPGVLREQPIAIVGVSCRFAGAKNLAQLAENLERGVDSVREVPKGRWDSDRYHSDQRGVPGKANSKWGGFLDEIERFDAKAFGVSPREAAHMDPQQRLLLEEAWHCLEDAGIAPTELQSTLTGVFVGVMAIDYHQNATFDLERVTGYTGAGNYACMLANRISHHFGFRGPSESIDAACASSLVALHAARRALLHGECTQAIVGAASLDFNPYKYIAFSQAHMLSPDGRCKTFDASANGYVPGEGVAAVLLEPLEQALASGHRIHAVLLGSAVNHNGAGASLTAPSVQAQVEVIERACRDAGVNPASLTYVETHGTGTSLGDPIEVEALKRVLSRAEPGACALGSVKSNLGHCEAAAGLAGVVKVISMLRRGRIFPTLHVRRANPLLALEGSSVRVSVEGEPWLAPKGDVLRAGVSSFGFGGVNSHVVLEQPPLQHAPARLDGDEPLPFVISAHSPEQLEELIASYRTWASSPAFQAESLAAISTTMLRGRRWLPLRLGMVAQNRAELAEALANANIAQATRVDTAPAGLELHCATATSSREAACWLGALGCAPTAVSGEGAAVFEALALSGALDPSRLSQLEGRQAPNWAALGAELTMPSRPFFDPLERRWIEPPAIDIEHLVSEARTSLSTALLERAVALHRDLFDHQFTYRRFVEEWEVPLRARGQQLHRSIDAAERHELPENRDRGLLLLLMLSVSLERLHQKWELESPLQLDAACRELVTLAVDQVLPREHCLDLLLGSEHERIDAVRAANERLRARGVRGPEPRWLRAPDWGPACGDGARWLAELERSCNDAAAPTHAARVGASRVRVVAAPKHADSDWLDFDARAPAIARQRAMLGAALWQRGHAIDAVVLSPQGAARCALPLYPFRGERHWLPLVQPKASVADEHSGGISLSVATQGTLGDHVIDGRVIAPGAHLLGLMLGLDRPAPRAALGRVVFVSPAFVEPRCDVQVEHSSGRVLLRTGDQVLASARLAETGSSQPVNEAPRDSETFGEAIERDWLYRVLYQMGYAYGPRLRVVKTLRGTEGRVVARLELSGTVDGALDAFTRLLDGAFHAVLGAWRAGQGGDEWVDLGPGLFVPHAIDGIELAQSVPWNCLVDARFRRAQGDLLADISAWDDQQRCVFSVRGARFRKIVGLSARPSSARAEPAALGMPAIGLEPCWTPIEAPAGEPPPQVLVVGASEALAGQLRAELLPKGSTPTFLDRRTQGELADEVLDAGLAEVSDRVSGNTGSNASPSVGLLWFTPTNEGRSLAEHSCAQGFELLRGLQRIHASPLRGRVRLVVVTQNAQRVEPSDSGSAYHAAGFSGLVRSALAESARLSGCVLDTCDESISAPAVVAAFSGTRGASYALRGGDRWWIQRLRQLEPLAAPGRGWAPRGEGAYLVVGGAGGVGLRVVEWLRQWGARRVVVLGRSALPAERREAIEALEGPTFDIAYARADVTDLESMRRTLAAVRARWGGLSGVIHCGGVLEDRFFTNKERDSFERVVLPKVAGAFNLDQLTRDDPLECFVLFSSVVALSGNLGQTDYAFANGCLDAFVSERQQRCPAQLSVSINWTVFDGPGMASAGEARQQLERLGLFPLGDAAARTALHRVLTDARPRVAVVAQAIPPLLESQIVKQERPRQHTDQSKVTPMITISPSEPTAAKVSSLETARSRIRQALAETLSVSSESLDDDVDLSEYGVNSLAIMEVVTKLEQHYGDRIHHSALLEYPTIAALSEQLAASEAESLEPAPEPPAVASPGSDRSGGAAPAVRRRAMPIAILSRACRLPGADTPDAFWQNLRAGKVMTRAIPASRFRTLGRAAHQAYPQRGCFVDGLEWFDAALFNISVEDATAMDPQQRVFLELAQELFDGAGYGRAEIAGRNVGIFVGTHENEYGRWIARRPKYAGKAGVVNVICNMIVGHVANAFDLRGPAQTIFTACSSSLVAVHEACAKLANGECEMAIAGGIEFQLDDAFLIGFSSASVLSPDGVCRVFDRGANGFVLGEGAGAVLLKRLDRALADGDPIVGVILGSSTNNDGATMGLTTPNLEAQKSLIESTLDLAQVSPASVGYYEAHGTGTQLGDPIEVKAATEVFRKQADGVGYCGLGSVKANIGHSLSAAGISSLLKASLLVERGELVPTVNCSHPRFDFSRSPFLIVEGPSPWRAPGPRHACVSSFGFGGTNCHVVLREAPDRYRPTRQPLPPRQFKRVRCWLDLPHTAPEPASTPECKPEATAVLGSDLARVLTDLKEGRIGLGQARQLIRVGETPSI